MAKAPGRLAVVSKNAVAIASVRMSSVSWAGEFMDVTDRDSSGIVEYLSAVKTQQITLSVEGVANSPVLRDIAMTPATSKLLTDITFKFADALTAADTIAGNFVLTSYKEENPHDDTATFSAELMSSGTWTLA